MKTVKHLLWVSIITLFSISHCLLQGREFEAKKVTSSKDLPEEFCNIWKEGDYLLSDGKFLALIGGTSRPLQTFHQVNAMGSIISLVPAGNSAMSDLGLGAPLITIKEKRHYVPYSSVAEVKQDVPKGSVRFLATALYEEGGRKAEVKTTYTFSSQKGKVDITSTLRNTGTTTIEELDYTLSSTALHSYSFSPFHREKHPHLNFIVYPKKGHYLAWINLNPLKDESSPEKLAPGKTFTVNYAVLTATTGEDLLKNVYQALKVKTFPASLLFKDFEGDCLEVIVMEAFSGSIFFRSFLSQARSLEIPLPPETYLVTANFFPAVSEAFLRVKENVENSCQLACPPLEKVKVKIIDRMRRYVPGKVAFIGLQPTKSPYFEPVNPVESGRRWESFKNSVFPRAEGEEVRVPVGKYLVYASRGPEYTTETKIIELLKGESQELTFFIDKAVETKGLISLDPHMHTQNSDGTVRIPERIKSLVAEGVDAVVASDHNYISDYLPALKELGLEKYLAVNYGNEVTTGGVIHYNTYPLQIRPEEENNGAISPLGEVASPLFIASRTKDPGAIIQVNHPRSGSIGYFNNFFLDKESAAFALDTFDISFDVLEIMNGPYIFYRSNNEAIEDWLHLLNRGYYFPLVGSSDSHTIDMGEPGYSRTYVFYKGEKGENLDWEAVREAIKKGRSFATNGPLVRFMVNGKYTSGDTFTAKGGRVRIWLEVQSAPWVSVDEVKLIVNGERKMSIPVERKNLSSASSFKFTERKQLILDKDSYLVLEVIGKKSLYPVLQRSSTSGEFIEAALPYALTNPVFIDVDGNRKFDPPLEEKIKLTKDIPKQKKPQR